MGGSECYKTPWDRNRIRHCAADNDASRATQEVADNWREAEMFNKDNVGTEQVWQSEERGCVDSAASSCVSQTHCSRSRSSREGSVEVSCTQYSCAEAV